MVRRPSLKWNFHASSCSSMKVDLLQPARLFLFHFLLPSALTELLTEYQKYLDAENFLCAQVDQRFGLLLPYHLAFWAPEKKTENKE